ncbi:MAG: response regulator transcription factor [Phycisphaeraceae bacterium]
MTAPERPASVAKAKILIVDDHPIIRSGMRYLIGLEGDLEVCGEADSVQGALACFDDLCPDLVLLDLSLPDGTGWDVIQHLRQHWLGTKILVVSGWDRFNATAAIEAGAMGFVSKHDANEKLIEAIRTVLNNQTYAAHSTTRGAGGRS